MSLTSAVEWTPGWRSGCICCGVGPAPLTASVGLLDQYEIYELLFMVQKESVRRRVGGLWRVAVEDARLARVSLTSADSRATAILAVEMGAGRQQQSVYIAGMHTRGL